MLKVLKSLVLIYFFLFLLGAAGVGAVVYYTNPGDSPLYYPAALYLCFFLAVFGLAAVLGLVLRHFAGSAAVSLFKTNITVIRQSVFLAVIMSLGLYFQSLRLLNPLTAILLVGSLGILELYFLARD